MNERIKMAIEELKQNKEMQEEIKQNPPKSIDDLIVLAKRLGVELTKADFELPEDMTDEEMKQIAGGKDAGEIVLTIFCVGVTLGFACSLNK